MIPGKNNTPNTGIDAGMKKILKLSFASNGFEVSAFDVSKRAVELTTTALKKYGYNNCDVKVASITDTG